MALKVRNNYGIKWIPVSFLPVILKQIRDFGKNYFFVHFYHHITQPDIRQHYTEKKRQHSSSQWYPGLGLHCLHDRLSYPDQKHRIPRYKQNISLEHFQKCLTYYRIAGIKSDLRIDRNTLLYLEIRSAIIITQLTS